MILIYADDKREEKVHRVNWTSLKQKKMRKLQSGKVQDNTPGSAW